MKTARNIFIATLAVADSTLCVLTMPMTLLGVLTKYWPFGTETEVLCTIVRTWPAINAFFSSYTMAVIAFDRHRFIVHSMKRQVRLKRFRSLGNFNTIWILIYKSLKGLKGPKLQEDERDRQIWFNIKLFKSLGNFKNIFGWLLINGQPQTSNYDLWQDF